MRITHVITRLVVGGAQENTIASVHGLRQQPGFDLKLISGPSIGPEGSMESEVADVPGLLALVPELVRPVHPWKDWIALRRLTRIFQQTRPHLVHTHSGKAGILGRMAAARTRVPIVIHHIHGPSFGPFQGALANAVFTAAERYAARFTDHFFCSAQAMTDLYLSAGIGVPAQYTRVFSGFDVDAFRNVPDAAALRARLGFSPADFVIGKIGRITALKGHGDLLRAVRDLLPHVANARILFVGDGSLRQQVETQARELGLANRVTFTGLAAPADVPGYISAMDCVAHLSYREALSRALPQALAAGKPIIAYNFAGANEVCMNGQTGFLVDVGAIATVTQCLLKLAQDPGLGAVLGKRGQELVAENFTVENMVRQQAEVYRRLAREKGISP
ncbi:MAG TPA: glycosyltransferase [Verrucomicrobiae bacterium]|nr:glycosyltransferase [Verrucomicrobiae bacterium]